MTGEPTAPPTVTLATRATVPTVAPGSGSTPGSGPSTGSAGSGRSVGSSSRVSTPADALRLDEVRRLRILATFAAIVCTSAGLVTVPMQGDELFKLLHFIFMMATGIAGAWVTWRLGDPDRYQAWVITVFAVFAGAALATAFLYWGVYSSAVLFVPIALYFLASGSYVTPILVMLVLGCVPHALLGGLTAFGIIEDRGLVRAVDHLGIYEQVMVAGIAQLAFLVAYLLARGTRRSTIDAVEQLVDALLQALVLVHQRVAGQHARHAAVLLRKTEQQRHDGIGLLQAAFFFLRDLVDQAEHGLLDELDQPFEHLRLAGEVAVQRRF